MPCIDLPWSFLFELPSSMGLDSGPQVGSKVEPQEEGYSKISISP